MEKSHNPCFNGIVINDGQSGGKSHLNPCFAGMKIDLQMRASYSLNLYNHLTYCVFRNIFFYFQNNIHRHQTKSLLRILTLFP